jgi:hypothetical protein
MQWLVVDMAEAATLVVVATWAVVILAVVILVEVILVEVTSEGEGISATDTDAALAGGIMAAATGVGRMIPICLGLTPASEEAAELTRIASLNRNCS